MEFVTREELAAQPPPLVAEWKRLCDGVCRLSDAQSSSNVEKVQLVGPITLIAGEYAPLQQTFRRTRAALDTLLQHFPNTREVWLDEPALDLSRAHQVPLLAKCLSALRAEFFDLRFGVHLCNNAPWRDVVAIDAIDVLHFDAWTFEGDFLANASNERTKPLEVVAGIIPTTGPLPSIDALVTRITRVANGLPQGITLSRLSTSCGLATLEPADASSRLQLLDELVATLNE